MVRPRPAVARKAAESNLVILLLVKMLLRFALFVWQLLHDRKASPYSAALWIYGELVEVRESSPEIIGVQVSLQLDACNAFRI